MGRGRGRGRDAASGVPKLQIKNFTFKFLLGVFTSLFFRTTNFVRQNEKGRLVFAR